MSDNGNLVGQQDASPERLLRLMGECIRVAQRKLDEGDPENCDDWLGLARDYYRILREATR
jgi:hypothetical protein